MDVKLWHSLLDMQGSILVENDSISGAPVATWNKPGLQPARARFEQTLHP
jgi:hypothetical protein